MPECYNKDNYSLSQLLLRPLYRADSGFPCVIKTVHIKLLTSNLMAAFFGFGHAGLSHVTFVISPHSHVTFVVMVTITST